MTDPSVTFADDVTAALRLVYGAGAEDAADTLGISFDYLDANAQRYGQARGAELVGMKRLDDGSLVTNPNAEWAISDTTRERVNELLQEAMEQGWSPQKFASRLEESGLFSEARAEAIARTEVALAQNAGQVETYKAAGVDRLYVYDGGATDTCEECAALDGKVCSVRWAEANPLEHVNCTRSFSPAPDDAEIDLD